MDKHFRTLTIDRSEDDHVANQIEHLRQSRCFQNSDVLTCVTCHDPHRSEQPHMSSQNACGQCHVHSDCGEQDRLPEPVRDDCIGCHMPRRIKINVKFRLQDDDFVPPISRYDHHIAVNPVARDEVLLEWYRRQPDTRSQEKAALLTDALVEHWRNQAEEYRRNHRFLAAIAALREALLLGEFLEVRTELEKLVEIQADLYERWAKALHLITQNRSKEAMEVLTAILQIKPDDAETHSKLGTLYAISGQKQLAERHLRAVAEHDPNNPSGYGVLGKMFSMHGEWGSALNCFRRAAEIEPYNSQIQFDLAMALIRSNRVAEAIEHLQQARVIDPTRVDTLLSLAEALAHLRRWNEAAEAASKALQLAQAGGDPRLIRAAGRQLNAIQDRADWNP